MIATQVHEALYRPYTVPSAPRYYLGLSGLGDPCWRRVWYGWRHVLDVSFPPRIRRLFARGFAEEDLIINDLRRSGYHVMACDPASGRQFEVTSCGGLVRGHLDGLVCVDGSWYVLECKTANKNSFSKLKKNGCQKEQQKHWVQVQMYLALLRARARRDGEDCHLPVPTGAIYIVTCKDDDEIYCEDITADADTIRAAAAKARTIVTARQAPGREYAQGSWQCRYCDYSHICYALADASDPSDATQRHCRSCRNAYVDARTWVWRCDGEGCAAHLLPSDRLPEACCHWQPITR